MREIFGIDRRRCQREGSRQQDDAGTRDEVEDAIHGHPTTGSVIRSPRLGELSDLRPGVLSTRASHDPDAFAVAGIEQRLDLGRHRAASVTPT